LISTTSGATSAACCDALAGVVAALAVMAAAPGTRSRAAIAATAIKILFIVFPL
jgi:hypothetical protein